jgi:hypothetical protein
VIFKLNPDVQQIRFLQLSTFVFPQIHLADSPAGMGLPTICQPSFQKGRVPFSNFEDDSFPRDSFRAILAVKGPLRRAEEQRALDCSGPL